MSERLLGGRYQLGPQVGKGPQSTVHRAQQGQKTVAIKILAREAVEPRALEAFRKFAPQLARVRHPGIAGFIELVEDEGRVCLVSEFVQGAALSSLLKDGACPEPQKAWDIARHMLEGLASVHAQNVTHRNLHPGNVIVLQDGAAVLTDVATAVLQRPREEGVEYLSPEHIEREKLTPRSDIYQAGVIVYQLVTGKLPFTGAYEAVAHRVLEERPTDPSSYNRQLAWQLDWVVQKALSKDPEERFKAATDFAEGLRLGLQDTIGRPLTVTPGASGPPPVKPAEVKPTLEPLDLLPEGVELEPVADTKPAALAHAVPARPERPVSPAAPAKPAAPTPAPPVAKPVTPTPAEPAREAKAAPAPARTASQLLQNARRLAERPATPAAAATQAPAPAAAKPGILFVDDDPRILTALRALFRQEYEVQTAEGGEAALALLAKGGFQVIVSDQRMPGMTGVELLRKAKAVAPQVVRVLLTGYTDLASLVGSINQGEIFRFVMKPWDNEELRKALAESVALAQKAAGAGPAGAQAPRSAGSLLVIDRGEGIARGLERLLAGGAKVIRVESPAEAAKVLSREEIAAVVADMGAGMDGLVALFRELRAKRPGVLSILLTDEPDSALAIELINRAQIFRLLPKPVSARDLRTQVAEALRRYAAFKQRATGAPE